MTRVRLPGTCAKLYPCRLYIYDRRGRRVFTDYLAHPVSDPQAIAGWVEYVLPILMKRGHRDFRGYMVEVVECRTLLLKPVTEVLQLLDRPGR